MNKRKIHSLIALSTTAVISCTFNESSTIYAVDNISNSTDNSSVNSIEHQESTSNNSVTNNDVPNGGLNDSNISSSDLPINDINDTNISSTDVTNNDTTDNNTNSTDETSNDLTDDTMTYTDATNNISNDNITATDTSNNDVINNNNSINNQSDVNENLTAQSQIVSETEENSTALYDNAQIYSIENIEPINSVADIQNATIPNTIYVTANNSNNTDSYTLNDCLNNLANCTSSAAISATQLNYLFENGLTINHDCTIRFKKGDVFYEPFKYSTNNANDINNTDQGDAANPTHVTLTSYGDSGENPVFSQVRILDYNPNVDENPWTEVTEHPNVWKINLQITSSDDHRF